MGLQGANKSAHWDGWEIENPLEMYCISFCGLFIAVSRNHSVQNSHWGSIASLRSSTFMFHCFTDIA